MRLGQKVLGLSQGETAFDDCHSQQTSILATHGFFPRLFLGIAGVIRANC